MTTLATLGRAWTLSDIAAMAFDPVLLFEAAVGQADPWQRTFLRAESTVRDQPLHVAALTARQLGKSRAAATLAVHKAAFWPGVEVGIASPSQRQSNRLLRVCRQIVHALPHVRAVGYGAESLKLSNGSVIHGYPGNNEGGVRGDTLARLIVEEAAWCTEGLLASVYPSLMQSGGDIILISTAGAPSGFFADVFLKGGPEWTRVLAKASECPRVYTPAKLARARRILGGAADAELECEFRAGSDAVFADIRALLGLDRDDVDDGDDFADFAGRRRLWTPTPQDGDTAHDTGGVTDGPGRDAGPAPTSVSRSAGRPASLAERLARMQREGLR